MVRQYCREQHGQPTCFYPASPTSRVPKVLAGAGQELVYDLPQTGGQPYLEHFADIEAGPAIQLGGKVDAPGTRMKGHGAHKADHRPGDSDLAGRLSRLFAGRSKYIKGRLGKDRRGRVGVLNERIDAGGRRIHRDPPPGPQ